MSFPYTPGKLGHLSNESYTGVLEFFAGQKWLKRIEPLRGKVAQMLLKRSQREASKEAAKKEKEASKEAAKKEKEAAKEAARKTAKEAKSTTSVKRKRKPNVKSKAVESLQQAAKRYKRDNTKAWHP